jgi:hypothetical protein
MGYRSDVAYSIRFFEMDNDGKDLDPKLFYTFLAEAKSNPNTGPCFSTDEGDPWCVRVDIDKHRIDFSIIQVKWYENSGFPEIDAHTTLMDLARDWLEQEHPIAYKFVRVGEELNDIEEEISHDYAWDEPYIARSIVTEDA